MKQSYPPVTTKNNDIEEISERIILMAKRDQEIRAEYSVDKRESVLEKMDLIDSANRKEFKEIFNKSGYIGSKYGKEAQFSAFLLVQHMPKSEIKFVQKYLSLMKKDLEGIEPNNFAQLCDRVRTREGKRQLYGTQFMPVEGEENTYKLMALYKPNEVDKRRLELGLVPLKVYIKRLSSERKVRLIL